MGLLDCASGDSIWRGYDYFKEEKVADIEQIGQERFVAKVCGSSGNPYSVELHLDHPRKSKCNCPHADGRRIICKHIVATFFTVLPNVAEAFYADAMAYREEEAKRQEDLSDKVCHYVRHMKKNELQQALLQLLFDGPEWQYDRFIRENGLDER